MQPDRDAPRRRGHPIGGYVQLPGHQSDHRKRNNENHKRLAPKTDAPQYAQHQQSDEVARQRTGRPNQREDSQRHRKNPLAVHPISKRP